MNPDRFNNSADIFMLLKMIDTTFQMMTEFEISYEPDFRQEIAESWPSSIDDSAARKEWGWKPDYDLAAMVKDMLEKLSKKLGIDY